MERGRDNNRVIIKKRQRYTPNTHTHTHMYIYIYKERERGRMRDIKRREVGERWRVRKRMR